MEKNNHKLLSDNKYFHSHNKKSHIGVSKVPQFSYSVLSLGLVILLSFNWFSVGFAQDAAPITKTVRAIETEGLGIQNLASLAISQDEYILSVRVAASSDDAEEGVDGT